MLQKLQYNLMQKVKRRTLTAKVLLNRFYFPDENLKQSSEYQDNTWWPFWYYLGLEEKPKKIVDVGSKYGLETSCCMLGLSPPISVSVYSPESRFVKKNLQIMGNVELESVNNWDLAVVNGDFLDHLDSIWDNVRFGGLVCIINNRENVENFAKAKNHISVFCKLRYSVGLLRK